MEKDSIICCHRGSQWHKWDLHMHSPKTWLNNGYTNTTNDNFIQAIIKSNLKAIGLTNYFKFAEGEIDSDNSLRQELKSNGVTVFPNLEFRINQKNKDGKFINIHILFSEETSSAQIKQFLTRLKTIDGKYCIDLKHKKDFESALVELSSLKKELDELKHQCIIIGCPNGYGGYRPSEKDTGRGRSLAITIDKISTAFFSSNNPTKDSLFFSNTKRYGKNDEASIKPVFKGSDAHRLKDVGKEFTWVKANPTFEGLLQTCFSPRTRIKYTHNNPENLKNPQFIIDTFSFGGKTIYLNSGINSVIGRRGSGKSTLLKALVKTVDPQEFSERAFSSDQNENDSKFIDNAFDNVQITWKEQESSGIQSKKVFYIPQGYLSSMTYDGGNRTSERDTFLRKLFLRNPSFYNAINKQRAFVTEQSQIINKILDGIFNLNEEVSLLENNLRELGNEKSAHNNLERLNTTINELSKFSKVTKNDSEKYQKAKEAVAKYSRAIEINKQDLQILTDLNVKNIVFNMPDQRANLLSEKVYEKLTTLIKNNTSKNISSSIAKIKKELQTNISSSKVALSENKKIVKELASSVEKHAELAKMLEKKTELQNTISLFKKYNTSIDEKRTAIKNSIKELCDIFGGLRTGQEKIIGTVQMPKFKFIKISPVIKETINFYEHFIDQNINTRKQKQLSPNSKKFLADCSFDHNDVQYILEDLLNQKFALKTTRDQNYLITAKELFNNPYEIDFLGSITSREDGTLFSNMTGGQKTMALLEIIFQFDKNNYPIFIDQPEDDIDANGITENIVEFIKAQGEQRQLFVVTHNANLVVNTDSDNIIIANQIGKRKFEYKTGSIENKSIQKAIIDIMEGGKDALYMRMKKLRIDDIITK